MPWIAPGVVKEGWNGYNILHNTASMPAALDLGITGSSSGAQAAPAKFVYLLGSDDFNPADIPQNAFVVYQGHHGDVGASIANVILPGMYLDLADASYTLVPWEEELEMALLFFLWSSPICMLSI